MVSTPGFPEFIADRYQIGEVLGRGGMGEVRSGVDRALDRAIAVKFLRRDLADQPGFRARFEREARAAARITHPNVVAIYDIGENDGIPYLIMERLSGRTLADELVPAAIDPTRVRVLGLEILGALAVAHQLGVIHRDIKPANILLTPDGHAKVADFGIAKLAEDLHQTTTAGLVFGTVSYLAPERLAGRAASPSSDLYSVGVVLFEALTGGPAFRADTPLALAASVAHDEPRFSESQRVELDPSIVATVERAMAKDPNARFASADAMAAALAGPSRRTVATESALPTVAAATSSAPGSKRPDPRTVGPPPSKRRPVDDATAVLHRQPVTSQPSRRRRRRSARLIGLVGAAIVLAAAGIFAAQRGSSAPPVSNPPSSTGIPATGQPAEASSIPAPLQRSIDELERAVQR